MKILNKLFKNKAPDEEQLENEIDPIKDKLALLNGHSMSGLAVINNLYIIAEDSVRREIPGDVVECGVCNGGSAGSLALGRKIDNNKVWLYDSFEGMPEVTESDGETAKAYVGKCVGSIEAVMESMQIAGLAQEDFIVKKGWYKQTFLDELPDLISILHIDCDWYDSVFLSLTTFYDKVAEGGVIIIDDFGHWEGCREAVYNFFHEKKIMPLVERFGHTQLFWIKGRTHNRFIPEEKKLPFSKEFHK